MSGLLLPGPLHFHEVQMGKWQREALVEVFFTLPPLAARAVPFPVGAFGKNTEDLAATGREELDA